MPDEDFRNHIKKEVLNNPMLKELNRKERDKKESEITIENVFNVLMKISAQMELQSQLLKSINKKLTKE